MFVFIFYLMLSHIAVAVPCGLYDYQCKFQEPTCSCNIFLGGMAKIQIYTQSQNVTNSITYNQLNGMRIDSPSQISFRVNIQTINSLGFGYGYFKSTVRLQNFKGQNYRNLTAYFRYFGSAEQTIYNQLLNFQIQTTLQQMYYDTQIIFLKQSSQSNSFELKYIFNLKQILFNRIEQYFIPNIYISGVDFVIVLHPQSIGKKIISMTVIPPILTSLCETRNVTIVSSQNLTILQEIYSDSKTTYTNLTRPISMSSISGSSIQFKYDELNCTTVQAFQNMKSYDYIGIGFINNKWVTPYKQYNLPFKVSDKIKLISNFTYYVNINSNRNLSSLMICYTILLQNSGFDQTGKALLTNNFQKVKIMICPLRTIYNPSKLFLNSTISYEQVQKNLTANITQLTYIFDLDETISQIKQLELNKYINIVKFKLNLNLSQYYIVGLQTGIQISSGKGTFAFKKFSLVAQFGNLLNPLCLFGAFYDELLDQCMTLSQVSKAVTSIVSIPNIDLFLKIGPFLNLLDDLSYFVYHNAQYDLNFKYLSQLSWNWTSSKWKPLGDLIDFTDLANLTENMLLNNELTFSLSSTDDYSRKWIKDTMLLTSSRLRWKNQDSFFLNNCRGYLFYTATSSIFIFFMFSKIYLFLSAREFRIAKFLQSFSSWSYLMVSLIGDNIQYLSFRSFEQLRFFVPNRGILSYVSIILSIKIGFIAIICSICLYFLSLRWAKSSFELSFFLRKGPRACCLLSIWLAIRMLLGFIHAYLDDSAIRQVLITILQGSIVVLSGFAAPLAKYKTILSVVIYGHIGRFLLYFIALMEIIFPQLVKDSVNSSLMSQSTYMLIMVLLVLNGIQIVLNLIVGIVGKSGKAIQKELHNKNKIALQQAKKTKLLQSSCQMEVLTTKQPIQSININKSNFQKKTKIRLNKNKNTSQSEQKVFNNPNKTHFTRNKFKINRQINKSRTKKMKTVEEIKRKQLNLMSHY